MMNDYEEDLDGFPAENKENLAESMVWSIFRRVDRSMYIRKWNHSEDSTSFLMDRRSGSCTTSSSTTGWILQCLRQKTRPSVEEQTFRRCRTVQRTTSQ